MATHQRNKICKDVQADISSSESLSFAGFLSVQDLQSKPPINNSSSIKSAESAQTPPESAARPSHNNRTATLSISNGQIQLQAFLFQTQQIQVNHKPCSKDAACNKKRSSDDKIEGTRGSNKPNHKGRKDVKKEHSDSTSSFGRRMFRSFFSPCRECHAQKPAIRAQNVSQETVKLH